MPRAPKGQPPRYKQIADDLRDKIESGAYAPGVKLPSEAQLMIEYDAARLTIRSAIGILATEGLTEARHGKGVYVLAGQWQPIVRNALKRLSAEQWGQGKSMWDVDIDDRKLEPTDVRMEHLPVGEDPDAARALGVERGELIVTRTRRYLVDRVPVMRATSFIPEDLARGTAITRTDTGPGGIYARLAEGGHGPVRFREEVRCRMPRADEMADLSIAATAPVVELTRYAYDARDRVVEVNRMILDASRYLLVYDFPA
ncbi:GntR family transcriptional regulator [Streptomyces sp. NPDC006544]|uniref:GntR family transcriptional regulator n=1 Tax=Streptomyces sp. NPDC006544 TaxID=3154583 RepID=UPI0033BF01F9